MISIIITPQTYPSQPAPAVAGALYLFIYFCSGSSPFSLIGVAAPRNQNQIPIVPWWGLAPHCSASGELVDGVESCIRRCPFFIAIWNVLCWFLLSAAGANSIAVRCDVPAKPGLFIEKFNWKPFSISLFLLCWLICTFFCLYFGSGPGIIKNYSALMRFYLFCNSEWVSPVNDGYYYSSYRWAIVVRFHWWKIIVWKMIIDCNKGRDIEK